MSASYFQDSGCFEWTRLLRWDAVRSHHCILSSPTAAFPTRNISHDFWQLLLRWTLCPKQDMNHALCNLEQTLHAKKMHRWDVGMNWTRRYARACVISNVWYRIRHHCVDKHFTTSSSTGRLFFPLNLKDRRDNRCWKAFPSYSLHCKMMHLLYLQADISALSWILHAEKCRGAPWLVPPGGHKGNT